MPAEARGWLRSQWLHLGSRDAPMGNVALVERGAVCWEEVPDTEGISSQQASWYVDGNLGEGW
jgi:hypothetical protein